jgi:WD40 repeat protein
MPSVFNFFAPSEEKQPVTIPNETSTIKSFGFNQNSQLFAYATSNGYSVFHAHTGKKAAGYKFDGGLDFVVLLFSTNLFLIVPSNSSTIIFWDDQTKASVAEIPCGEKIRSVMFHRDLFVVISETNIKIYNMNMEVFYSCTTYSNPEGVVAMSYGENTVLAYPGVEKGKIRVDHIIRSQKEVPSEKNTSTDKELVLVSKDVISAHQSEISCIALSIDGSLVATASTDATLIRVFSTYDKKKHAELRRGSSSSQIHSIAFSDDSRYLCCFSASGTVHLWDIVDKQMNKTSMLASFTTSEYFNSLWSMTQFSGIQGPAKCTFGKRDGDTQTVYVITKEGKLITITFDVNSGESVALETNVYEQL